MTTLECGKEKILSFIENKLHIYIYGAGKYGKVCMDLLQHEGISIDRFIETKPNLSSKYEMEVKSISEMSYVLLPTDAVIIAAKAEYAKKMVENIPQGIPFLCLNDEEWYCLYTEEIFKELKYLSKEYPIEPISSPKTWRKILIVRLDVIGDMVWTTAFLRELKNFCNEATITMIIRPELKELMSNCPYVDRFIYYDCMVPSDRRDYDNLRQETSKFVDEYLQNDRYDVVFLPRAISESDLLENLYLAIFSGARQRVGKVGSKTNTRFIECLNEAFSVLVKEKYAEHEVDRILDMLYACSIPVTDKKLELWPSKSASEKICRFLEDKIGSTYRERMLISVGLVSRDGNRTWPADRYSQLIKEVYASNHNVIFILNGGSDSKETAIKIGESTMCIDFTGKCSLDETVALMKKCIFYLGVNTGLLHIATALNKPVIEISGQWRGGDEDSVLSPKRVGAYGVKSIIVRPETAADDECRKAGFCIKKKPHCICRISVDKVKNAVINMIEYIEKNY